MERKKNKPVIEKTRHERNNETNSTVFLIKIGILITLHVVGIIGFTLDEYHAYFQQLIPFHLLLISLILFWDESSLRSEFWIFFGSTFLIGYLAEVFGVKSGLIFGYYEYKDWMGPKFLDVPILIGLLWASVAYACNQIAAKLFSESFLFSIIIAALLMVFFDFMMEPFAVSNDLWTWKQSSVPPYNYVCWFVIGLIMSLIYRYTLKNLSTPIAPYFIIIQILFFLIYQLLNKGVNLLPFE